MHTGAQESAGHAPNGLRLNQPPRFSSEAAEVLRLFPVFVWKAQLAPGVYEPINAALLAEVAGLLPTPGAPPPATLWQSVLLGRVWGADVLGIYGRAYELMNVPTENMNSAVGEVAFAALPRVRCDPARVRSYFLKGYSLVLAMTLPTTEHVGRPLAKIGGLEMTA